MKPEPVFVRKSATTKRRSNGDEVCAPEKPKTHIICIGKASMLLTKLLSAEPVSSVPFVYEYEGDEVVPGVTDCIKPVNAEGSAQCIPTYAGVYAALNAPDIMFELSTESRAYVVTLSVELIDTATVTQLPPKSVGTNCGGPIDSVHTYVVVFATVSYTVAYTFTYT